jgi:cyclophilin family peptidyl-prolyl cis-trans isomerase
LDDENVVFGRVIKGQEIVDQIQMHGNAKGTPNKSVIISDCGVLKNTIRYRPKTYVIEKKEPKKLKLSHL